MKKLLLSFATIAIFFSVVAATCKEDPIVEPTPTITEYTCKCTYVAATGSPSDGQPNKEETVTVKSETLGGAKVDCASQQGKYINQFFNGTCNIQ